MNRKTLTDGFSIYLLGVLLILFWIFTRNDKEFFDGEEIPANADADANACLAVVNTFKKMVDDNRAQHDKKVKMWEAGRTAHAREYNLGKTPAMSPMYGKRNPRSWTLSCQGQGNWITEIGGKSGKYLDRVTVRCRNGGLKEEGGGGGGRFASVRCPNGFNQFKVWSGEWIDRFAAKCSNGVWAKSSNLSITHPHYGNNPEFSCPSGTVLKEIRGKSGSFVDRLQFICAPPDYKTGNWPTLTSYYVGKTGKTKPAFRPIPVSQLPCQYCINKVANVTVDDSKKVDMVQSCANNIKQAELQKAKEAAKEKEKEKEEEKEEERKKMEEEIRKKIESEEEAVAEETSSTGMGTGTRVALTGTFLSICCLIAVIVVMGVILFTRRR